MKSMFVFATFVTLLCLTKVEKVRGEVDWSNLNSTSISKLDPVLFSNISLSELSSIPPFAFQGLTPAQLPLIPTSAILGIQSEQISNITNPKTIKSFTSQQIEAIPQTRVVGFGTLQIKNLNSESCKGISSSFFEGLSFSSYSAFTSDCLDVVNSTSFGGIPAKGLGKIVGSIFKTFSSSQLFHLADSSAIALTSSQVSNLTANSCSGLRSSFVSNISAASLSFISFNCVQNANATIFESINDVAASLLPLSVVSVLSESQIQKFSRKAVKGFSPQQISALSPTTGCKGIGSDFVKEMRDESIGGWKGECIMSSTSNSFSLISPNQVLNISSTAFQGLQQKHVEQFNLNGVGAISEKQISNLRDDAGFGCHGMHSNFASALLSASFKGFYRGCISASNDSFFGTVGMESVKKLAASAVNGVRKSHMIQMGDDAASGFTETQTGSFTTDACEGIGSILSSFQPTSVSGFSSNCIAAIPAVSFKSLTKGQFKYLNCTSLTLEQVSNLNSVFSSIRQSCLSDLSPDSFGGITAEEIQSLNNKTVSLISPLQLRELNDSVVTAMKLDQLQSLSNSAMTGFRADQLGNLTQRYGLSFVNLYPLKRWNPSPFSAQNFVTKIPSEIPELIDFSSFNENTTWIQLALMKNATPNYLNAEFVNKASPITFLGLRPSMIPNLTNDAIAAISTSQASYLLPNVFAAFNIAQIQQLKPQTFGNLFISDFFLLTPQEIDQITSEQFKAIPAAAYQNCEFSKVVKHSGREGEVTGDSKKFFEVCYPVAPPPEKHGLTIPQIVGITVGGVVFIVFIIVAVYLFVTRKKESDGYESIE